MMLRTLSIVLLAALAVPLTAAPARAAEAPAPGSAPLLAGYWHEFLDHWSGVFQKQNGIVLATVLVGVVCLFIITRGKWRK